jgi:hypothetical protein
VTTRLATAQRELARWLRAPDGVRPTLADAGDPEGRTVSRWIRGDARVGAVDRVEIYANAYFFRIRDALASEFEVLATALGESGFHDLVTAYLIVRPSTNPSLRWAGEGLAEFLAEHPGATPFRRRWPWSADLARLEWALSRAFDAADDRPLGREDLASIDAERWADLRFGLHPSVSLLFLEWPVHAIWSAHLREDGPGRPERTLEPGETTLLCWRMAGMPRHRVVEAEEARWLRALSEGETFGDLCARAIEGTREAGDGEEGAAARAAGHLARCLESELIAAVESAG